MRLGGDKWKILDNNKQPFSIGEKNMNMTLFNDPNYLRGALITVTYLMFLLVGLSGCTTGESSAPKLVEGKIVKGKTTEAELLEILGKPSFYAKAEQSEGRVNGKYWVYVSWRGNRKWDWDNRTVRKVLVRDGVVVDYTSSTTRVPKGNTSLRGILDD
jgi:hypothetical protein